MNTKLPTLTTLMMMLTASSALITSKPAAAISLSDTPLFLSSAVDPNVFFEIDTGNTNTNGAAIFGLYQRNEFNNAETLMVDGVEDFQVLYGVNTNNDNNKTPDIYQTASAVTNWERVVSVRIFLLLNSVDNVLGQVQPYTFMGNVVANPGDRMLRREFTATIGVRNRSL